MAHSNITIKKGVFAKITLVTSYVFIMVLFSQNVIGQSVQPFGEGITAKKFFSSTVDKNNTVWFLTESGIVSYNGTKWSLQNNPKVGGELKNLGYGSSANGDGLWVAGPNGATVISNPVDAGSDATTYTPENSKIMSKNVYAVSVSKNNIRWFGTDNGISAFDGTNWLTNNYADRYPEDIFQYFPFSTMATSDSGDTLYVGTLGGGVMRFYKDDVDAVSGASEYAIWGPIIIPSDSIFSVFIAPDGSQWIGTDKGVAKKVGHNALEGWTIFDTKSGLVDDKVQAINIDSNGKMYFGTKNGLSIYDGTKLTNFKVENGLVSNNILTIAVDKNNLVWLGTDNGVSCLKDGSFTNYK